MKKNYSLLTFLMLSIFTLAQTPIITAIADGDCSGGTPKMLEIYAHGTVDFSQFSLENQTNGNTDWGSTQSLADFGTVTDGFVYVYFDSNNPEIFGTEFPSATTTLESNTINLNGNDRVRIINTSTAAVIDMYGADGVDGTGTAWEYKDGYAKRNNGTTANGSFVEANWTFNNGALDGGGSCQGGDTFETIMGGIGTFSPNNASETPTLTINSPSNGTTLDVGATNIDVTFSVENFEIGTTDAMADGNVQYFLNSVLAGSHYTNDPITITGLVTGQNTIKLALADNNGTLLDPEVSSTITVTVPSIMEVANIAELRNGMQDGTIYKLTGEAILTYQQQYRNQKFIEDTTGAILIDDSSGILSTAYNLMDGISNLEGTLGIFNGTLQFTPTAVGPAASSTGNVLEPASINIADYNTNFESTESELITINNVDFLDAGETFATGTNYTISQDSDELIVRTQFYDADVINQEIPVNAKIVGIAGRYNDTPQIYIISLEETLGVNNIDANVVSMTTVWNETANFNVKGNATVQIFNMNGQLIQTAKGNNNFAVNVNNLTQGVYVVKITVDGKSTVKKVVKK